MAIVRKKANIEYRILIIECRSNVFCLLKKKIEHSDSILRNSAVRFFVFSPFFVPRCPGIFAWLQPACPD
ncbi:hypothetical protein D1BOALGB6SA_8822 [Olavius sp. associated proteobacterium Delta 1]|nr:hypothetical protein D1BOALGB6SA_8822 [Olavius sp. associated proteobacterium Delta 1]